MKYLAIIYIVLILTACADKKLETFSFNSNVNNLYILAGEQGCYTPCQLKIAPSSDERISIHYDTELNFHMQPDRKRREGDSSSGGSSSSGSWGGGSGSWGNIGPIGGGDELAVALLLLTVTSTAITTTYMILENVDRGTTVWEYDTKAYYIYISGTDIGYALHDIEYTDFALRHFYDMRQEQFYSTQPYIDAFSELTGLSNIRELLAASNTSKMAPLVFLDMVTLAKAEEILNSDDLGYGGKISALSAFLWYDEERLRAIYSDAVYSDDTALFLRMIDEYLATKRTALED